MHNIFAAISKGLCVKGVSHDVSLSELSKHEELTESKSVKILKDEYLHCKKTLADIVIKLSELKEKYLSEYNKSNEKLLKHLDDDTATADSSQPSITTTPSNITQPSAPTPTTVPTPTTPTSVPTPITPTSVPVPSTPPVPLTPTS